MTLEEKLEHFTSITIENALKHSADVLQEYKESAANRFEEHKAAVLQQLEEEERVAKEGVKRAASKEYTMELMHIKRKYNHKQVELKEKLFAEVDELLEEFKKTDNYKELLIKYVINAERIAAGKEINIYIDSADAGLLDDIRARSGADVKISEISFGGGVKAEIPSRNMLIDNTFVSKIEEIKENYVVGDYRA